MNKGIKAGDEREAKTSTEDLRNGKTCLSETLFLSFFLSFVFPSLRPVWEMHKQITLYIYKYIYMDIKKEI